MIMASGEEPDVYYNIKHSENAMEEAIIFPMIYHLIESPLSLIML